MRNCRKVQSVFIVLYYVVLMLPILGFVTKEIAWQDVTLNARRFGLLGNSCLLALLSAGACMIVGTLAAAHIHNGRLRDRRGRWFFLLLAPIPYYIYALTWMYLVRMLGQLHRGIMNSAMTGLVPCIFVNVLSFLPLTTGLILAAMEQHDKKAEEMAQVYAHGNSVFFRIVFPAVLPTVFAAGILVFILSVTDFSVPSLFQYQTYTLEIFSEYSRGRSLGEIGLLAIPLICPVLILVMMMERGIASIPIRRSRIGKKGLHLTGMFRIMGNFAVIFCILQIVIPVSVFIYQIENWSHLIESIRVCAEELMISLLIAALAAGMAVMIAGPTGAWLSEKKLVWRLSAIFPLAVPSSLIAMGLLSAVNGSIFHELSLTVFFPALGCAIKYMPFVVLIFIARARRIHREELELARVYAVSERRYFRQILLPIYKPAILGSAALVFMLTLGEEGITLILMPPGYETLAVKIYNYLHYGASELVSGFCLLTVVFTALLLLSVWKAAGTRGKRG